MALIHRMFADRAARTPDALAVTGGGRSVRYRELDRAAAGVADVLTRRGLAPEGPVAVCLRRSPRAVAVLLGVWRAGGVVALTDPDWPADRLRTTLTGVGARILVTDADGRPDRVPPGIEVVDLDGTPGAGDRLSGPGADLPPDALAYLVPTSGSTGTPKSVGVTHRAITHRVRTHRDAYGITSDARSSWLAPPGSSVGVVELWPYLCTGASVHAADPGLVADPVGLRDWFVDTAITHGYVNMPLAELLYRLPWPARTALRLMTVGSDSVRTWPDADLPFEVAVEYGSTEANGVASCLAGPGGRLTSKTASTADRADRPPIGHCWPDVRGVVLDTDLSPVPAGGLGELYVGGPELARGYVGDPAATATRFVPDPAGGGRRLYRTGDLVRLRPDGRFGFHGRTDTQVKILGHRVEPAEVEAVLLGHDAVTDAAVVPVPAPDGGTRLVAYVVTAAPVPGERLRAHVAAALPAPMVPRRVEFLDALPLNTSNKVDRRALTDLARRPSQPPAGRDGTGVAGGEVEGAVLAAWSAVLGGDRPRMDEHFVRAGGDSLAAGHLLRQLAARYGVRLRLRAFYREPTPAALARMIRTVRVDEPGRPR